MDHTPAYSRMTPKARKEQITLAALAAAEDVGFANLTAGNVAAAANCSIPLVTRYLGAAEPMRKYVLQQAIKRVNLRIIAQGLVSSNKLCMKLSDDIKQKALASIIAK